MGHGQRVADWGDRRLSGTIVPTCDRPIGDGPEREANINGAGKVDAVNMADLFAAPKTQRLAAQFSRFCLHELAAKKGSEQDGHLAELLAAGEIGQCLREF